MVGRLRSNPLTDLFKSLFGKVAQKKRVENDPVSTATVAESITTSETYSL